MDGGTLVRDTGGRGGAGAGKKTIRYQCYGNSTQANTKWLQDSRDDAVQLEHQVVALLPSPSAELQLFVVAVLQLLLLVVAVRIEKARSVRMKIGSFCLLVMFRLRYLLN